MTGKISIALGGRRNLPDLWNYIRRMKPVTTAKDLSQVKAYDIWKGDHKV